MRGDFIGLWSESWREIWEPLAECEAAASATDMFCRLYSELAGVLKEPPPEEKIALLLQDDLLTEQAFAKALAECDPDIDRHEREEAYKNAINDRVSSSARNEALEAAVQTFAADSVRGSKAWYEALAEIVNQPKRMASVLERSLADALNDNSKSKTKFRLVRASQIRDEVSLIGFLESAHTLIVEVGGQRLANEYFAVLKRFIDRFGLRYDLRPPCQLTPSLSGIFDNLVSHLRTIAFDDVHLHALMQDFDHAMGKLRDDPSDAQIRTCIHKQVTVLEAIARKHHGVLGGLEVVCDELTCWPHMGIREAMRSVGSFAATYPGIRGQGDPVSRLRPTELRDLIALSIVLAGFSPYLTDRLDADLIYRGT